MPHPPQCSGLVRGWTQPPLQRTLPAGQAACVHVPPAHWYPAGQTFPQVPQLEWSLALSTQAELHTLSPGRQAQAPEAHTWAAPQAVPHAPQSMGLVWKLGQALRHAVPAQVHAPLTQRSPARQLVPQAPQWWESAARSTQLPEQLTNPGVQTQAPEAQVALAPQACPQAPQLPASLAGFTQAELQEISPAGHAHTPDTHDAPEGQAVVQLPQWLASVARSAQVPLQFVWDAEQVAGAPPPPPPQPADRARRPDRAKSAPRVGVECLDLRIIVSPSVEEVMQGGP